MESFYGGKQGYSFIFRPNLERADGYFLALGQSTDTPNNDETIWGAIKRSELLPGDYALITELDNTFTEAHGKFYRISETKKPILIGKIGNMCMKYPIQWYDSANTPSSISNNSNSIQEVDISFLNETESRTAETIKAYWVVDNSSNPPHIAISFEMPVPVIDRVSLSSNNLEREVQGTKARDPSAPYLLTLTDVFPSDSIIMKKSEYTREKKEKTHIGDVWFKVASNINEAFSRGQQVYTFDLLKELRENASIFKKENSAFVQGVGVTTHNSITLNLQNSFFASRIAALIPNATKLLITLERTGDPSLLSWCKIEIANSSCSGETYSSEGINVSSSFIESFQGSSDVPKIYLTYQGGRNSNKDTDISGITIQSFNKLLFQIEVDNS